MAFNQEEFVNLLADYYEFCNRVFWEHTTVAYPPAGGWPSINQDTMANLEKSDTAVDLLRHLPYVDFDPDRAFDPPHIMNKTNIVDYRNEKIQAKIRERCFDTYAEPCLGDNGPLPPSCVCFAVSEGRNGYNLVVDTADGNVYWCDPNGQHDEPGTELNDAIEQRYAGDEVQSWRVGGVNVYRPKDFFALCKERFRELRWIGIDACNVDSLRMDCEWSEDYEDHMFVVRRMQRAGWPGDGEGRDWDRLGFQASLYENESAGV
ncbi:hypothetical protein CPLU01_11038 [Colletotrichum plurivorum]|uniref:Uncharacterized protein n=1 Tax=Colletotrichum plurivorum TaxID=2175906 RepID=A0A8H6K2V6_9PEZI|nr:hypothetical protein CPLU01_11038 [Colletotrichum plurivorum]